MLNRLEAILLAYTAKLLQSTPKLGRSSSAEPDLEAGAQLPAVGSGITGPYNNNMDWAKVMVAFCLASAIDIAIFSIQVHSRLPLSFFLVSLFVLFSFSSFFGSKLLGFKFPTVALVLELAGVFFIVTGFFVAITIPFPLCLKVIAWIVYVVSFVGVIVCNCFYN